MKTESKDNKIPQEILITIRGKHRKTVGSPNPYAVAEQALGVRIDWKQSPPKGVRHLLAQVKKKKSLINEFDPHHSQASGKKPKNNIKKSTAIVKKTNGRKK